ncbi:Asp-tRNA(Asn)/Glu-tRNA(Gln) amidotransferase subunit GatA [soil metagenome]
MFRYKSIAQYHSDLLEEKTNCVTAVQFYLDKISQQKKLNAFVEVYSAEALEKAAALDAKRNTGEPLKKLHGVVMAIKDVICHKDHHVTAASRILKDFISLYNATAIQLLLDEDAIIIGSCNCDEFAMGSSNENSAYGPVLNAIGDNLVPGGSSGGSAVAVQAEMCMVSLGSDTGGSVRQPADFCGIVGLKPGYGTISRYGLIAYASSFDQIGIFGKTISDVAVMLEVMSKADAYDSTMNTINEKVAFDNRSNAENKKYRFCFFKQMVLHPSLDKEIGSKIIDMVDKLRAMGHAVDEIDFDLLDYIVPAYYVLTTAEASSNLSRYDGIRYGYQSNVPAKDLTSFYLQNRSEGFGPEVKRRIMLGTFVLSSGYYDAYYNKAQQVRKMLVDNISLVFSKYNAVILPTAPTTAYKIGDKDKDPIAVYLADIFTVFANLTGIPAISIPLFKHSNGLPFGMQVMTNKMDELTLLRISAELMQLSTEAV